MYNINQDGYTYIIQFSYKNIHFMIGKLRPFFTQACLHAGYFDYSARAANHMIKLKDSICGSTVAWYFIPYF
jgi:hypothetical protein